MKNKKEIVRILEKVREMSNSEFQVFVGEMNNFELQVFVSDLLYKKFDITQVKAVRERYGAKLFDYCLDNFRKHLGIDNPLTGFEITNIAENLVFTHHKTTCLRTFTKVMEGLGFFRQTHKVRDNKKFVRKYYFEIMNIDMLNEILAVYGRKSFNPYDDAKNKNR